MIWKSQRPEKRREKTGKYHGCTLHNREVVFMFDKSWFCPDSVVDLFLFPLVLLSFPLHLIVSSTVDGKSRQWLPPVSQQRLPTMAFSNKPNRRNYGNSVKEAVDSAAILTTSVGATVVLTLVRRLHQSVRLLGPTILPKLTLSKLSWVSDRLEKKVHK